MKNSNGNQPTTNNQPTMSDREVDEIMDGLNGDIRIGMKAYFFCLPFHHIGKVDRVTKDAVYLTEVISVSNAGSANDAVAKIVQGKAKPEGFEKLDRLVFMRQALSQFIPLSDGWKLPA